MDFIHYIDIKLKSFERAKSYFEKLPTTASDNYRNGFYDLVAQYSGEGYEYELMRSMNKDLIESTFSDEYNKLLRPRYNKSFFLYENCEN
jgi:hypothetical protein